MPTPAELVARVVRFVGEILGASSLRFEVGPTSLDIAASVGIAQLRVEGGRAESAQELIRRADAALYSAKARGRNRVEVAP